MSVLILALENVEGLSFRILQTSLSRAKIVVHTAMARHTHLLLELSWLPVILQLHALYGDSTIWISITNIIYVRTVTS